MADGPVTEPEVIGRAPWERQPKETDRAWEAFEVYRSMGMSRTFVKVAEKLGKSDTVIRRWAHAYSWLARGQAYDAHEARAVTQRIVMGTADMRQRMINQALAIQARAHARIMRMSETEIGEMKPTEIVALMKVGADIERRARDVDPEQFLPAPDVIPKFEIVILRPGGMVGVQFADGEYGYIPFDQVDQFRRDYPDAVVIL